MPVPSLIACTAVSPGVAVSGAVPDRNPKNQDWLILGATNQVHTVQDHAKLKLAYDFSPGLRASYTLGYWRNDNTRSVSSYLRDADGNPHGGKRAFAVTGREVVQHQRGDDQEAGLQQLTDTHPEDGLQYRR